MSDLAVNPKNAERHGHAHVQVVLDRNYTMPNLYKVDVPCFNKHDSRRSTSQVFVKLASETLSDKYANGDAADGLAPTCIDPDLQQVFSSHPVVEKARSDGVPDTKIIPVSLYWDGLGYTKRDSVVAFYFTELRSGQTHLGALLRVWPSVLTDIFM